MAHTSQRLVLLNADTSLYPNNGTKLIARSTTQDRMTQSSEYFLAGFFGKDAREVLFVERSRADLPLPRAGLD